MLPCTWRISHELTSPLEATGPLIVILQSLFSLFLTWNHSQIQLGISCPKFVGITIPGNIKKKAGKGSEHSKVCQALIGFWARRHPEIFHVLGHSTVLS